MRLAVPIPIPIDLPLQITCYVADAQAASMMERALEAPGSAWGPEVLGMPNTTFAWCICDVCATCDFWMLKRDSCIKRYPSGVCPSPARETAPGFSLRGRGCKAATPRTPHHVIWWDAEIESESDVRLRVERMIAQGKAHPDDRFFYVSWRR
jgi:hypothetical protein